MNTRALLKCPNGIYYAESPTCSAYESHRPVFYDDAAAGHEQRARLRPLLIGTWRDWEEMDNCPASSDQKHANLGKIGGTENTRILRFRNFTKTNIRPRLGATVFERCCCHSRAETPKPPHRNVTVDKTPPVFHFKHVAISHSLPTGVVTEDTRAVWKKRKYRARSNNVNG